MAIAAYGDRQIRYRVVRGWPGGPPKGAEIRPQPNRARQLERGGFIERIKAKRRAKTNAGPLDAT